MFKEKYLIFKGPEVPPSPEKPAKKPENLQRFSQVMNELGANIAEKIATLDTRNMEVKEVTTKLDNKELEQKYLKRFNKRATELADLRLKLRDLGEKQLSQQLSKEELDEMDKTMAKINLLETANKEDTEYLAAVVELIFAKTESKKLSEVIRARHLLTDGVTKEATIVRNQEKLDSLEAQLKNTDPNSPDSSALKSEITTLYRRNETLKSFRLSTDSPLFKAWPDFKVKPQLSKDGGQILVIKINSGTKTTLDLLERELTLKKIIEDHEKKEKIR